MFAWIRRRFLAPHALRLTETLARLEGLSWDDSEQHPSAIEPGGDSGSQAYACPGSSTRQPLGTCSSRGSDAFHVLPIRLPYPEYQGKIQGKILNVYADLTRKFLRTKALAESAWLDGPTITGNTTELSGNSRMELQVSGCKKFPVI
jgi:hypothetical protein